MKVLGSADCTSGAASRVSIVFSSYGRWEHDSRDHVIICLVMDELAITIQIIGDNKLPV